MFSVSPADDRGCTAVSRASRRRRSRIGQVGATRNRALRGFVADRYRVRLGTGEATFERARRALRQWRMFPAELAAVLPADSPIEVGTNVAVRLKGPGLWVLAAARIVYVVEETVECDEHAVERFGFAYGTLREHLECGEERWVVEWRKDDDSVWYELTAFSRPRHLLAWLGYPLVRWNQKRFARLSQAAMVRAAAEPSRTAEHRRPPDAACASPRSTIALATLGRAALIRRSLVERSGLRRWPCCPLRLESALLLLAPLALVPLALDLLPRSPAESAAARVLKIALRVQPFAAVLLIGAYVPAWTAVGLGIHDPVAGLCGAARKLRAA